jgi:hypothetical protein
VDGDVELSLVLVHAEVSSVETDNVTDLVADREVLESLGVDHDSGVVIVGGFAALGVKGGVNDLEGADILVGGDFVGEGGVNDDTVDVVVGGGSEGDLGEFGVLVLLALRLRGRLGGGG